MMRRADAEAVVWHLTGAAPEARLGKGRSQLFRLADGAVVFFETRWMKDPERGHYYIRIREDLKGRCLDAGGMSYFLLLPDEDRALRIPGAELAEYLALCSVEEGGVGYKGYNIPIFVRAEQLVAKGKGAPEVDWTRYAIELSPLVAEILARSSRTTVSFALQALRAKVPKRLPKGVERPVSASRVVRDFARSLKVAAWAHARAAGRCESCDLPAPFSTADGEPFLEVHHLHRLADGGPDVPANVVAVCPNCHRRLHYGSDATERTERLRARLTA